jgi:hypothetical protein
MVVCHALTKELHVMEIAKFGTGNDKKGQDRIDAPSFAVVHGVYISGVLSKLLHAPPELLLEHGALLEEHGGLLW